MRPASADAIASLADHVSGDAVIIVYISGVGGTRVFSSEEIEDGLVGQGGGRFYADGSQIADGSVIAGGDTTDLVGLCPWLTDTGQFTQGYFGGLSSIDVLAQVVAPRIQLRISNAHNARGYRQTSEIMAREPFLGARVDVSMGFTGKTISDVIHLASFAIRRIVEERDTVTFDCEGLAA